MAKKKKKAEIVRAEPVGGPPSIEREFDRLFDDLRRLVWPTFWRPFWRRAELGAAVPSVDVDVYEDRDDVVVKADLPGLGKNDISVTLTGTTLTIRGEKRKEQELKEENYYRSERSYGAFSRTVELPTEVKSEEARATFRDGVLEVRLPKTEEAKKKQVNVQIE